MKVRFVSDIVFEADNEEDAISKIIDHFIFIQAGEESGCYKIALEQGHMRLDYSQKVLNLD